MLDVLIPHSSLHAGSHDHGRLAQLLDPELHGFATRETPDHCARDPTAANPLQPDQEYDNRMDERGGAGVNVTAFAKSEPHDHKNGNTHGEHSVAAFGLLSSIGNTLAKGVNAIKKLFTEEKVEAPPPSEKVIFAKFGPYLPPGPPYPKWGWANLEPQWRGWPAKGAPLSSQTTGTQPPLGGETVNIAYW